jgi:dTMP kinase
VQNRSAQNIFITLEGPDGSGKSTQLQLLGDRLEAEGVHPVRLTREPGGTTLSEQVRKILMDWEGDPDPLVDALLFNAARRRHVTDVIKPALEEGATVVCDRFGDSTLAYQGYGSGGPLDQLRTIIDIATDRLRPVRTVLLDIPVEVGLSRRRGGSAEEMTRFETNDDAHGPAFHQRVREGYLEMATAEPERWRVVDAAREPDQVATSVWESLRDLFEP